jgi:YegS/Rv2252/BmrU family lipid kinase
MPNLTYSLLINTKSRKSRNWADSIENLLSKNGIELDRRKTVKSSEQLHEALREETKLKPDVLIIGGGDGTIDTAINYIADSDITLAIIPLGTSNYFAKALKLPINNIEENIRIIAKNQKEKITLGRANGHYFSTMAAVGLSVQVAQNVSDQSKRFLGHLAYYLRGIVEIMHHKSFWCEIILDDDKPIQFFTHQVVVTNGRYEGVVRMSPKSSFRHGQLSVVIFGRTEKRLVHLKNILYFIFPSWIRTQPFALSAKKITINTRPVRAIEIDGEVVSQTPVKFEVAPNFIDIVCDPKLLQGDNS